MTQLRNILFLIALVFLFNNSVKAQDTLPHFTVRQLAKGKVQVSWINPYDKVVQMIVQRSFDSTKYFRSVFSSQSPWLPQNGFVDNNASVDYKVYYRVHYVLEGGAYFFTPSKSPEKYTTIKVVKIKPDEKEETNSDDKNQTDEGTKTIKIYKKNKDSLIAEINYKDYRRFRDSVNKKTKDTIQTTENDDEIIIKPYVPKPVWKASTYIFTNDYGFVRILIPLAKQYKYKIIFYNEQNEEVLTIKHVKEKDLILDKSNFKNSGWFYFELYENEKLKEKNKIYVGIDK